MILHILINENKLGELFYYFNILTGVRIVLFDNKFEEIFSFPKDSCRFCYLIKSTGIGKKRCAESDINGIKHCRDIMDIYSYRCHAGLTETVAPVIENGVILGYVMFGQITDSPDKDYLWEQIKDKCDVYSVDSNILKKAFLQQKSLSKEKINAASKILEACASYIWLSALIKQQKTQIIDRLNKYVNENLSEELSINTVCKNLNIKRTALYESVKINTGMGVAQYINLQRVTAAKKLLEQKKLSIAEIAMQVGIPDYNYFSKVFKKYTDQSPRQYRKNVINL